MINSVLYIVVDLFSGAGGVTTGIENATINGQKIATVIAAVNHDAKAIASHSKNHPNAVHFIKRAVKPIHRFLAWIGCKAQR